MVGASPIYTVTYIQNTNFIATGHIDNTLNIWNYKNWELIGKLSGHKGEVTSLTAIPNTDLIASGSQDATIK